MKNVTKGAARAMLLLGLAFTVACGGSVGLPAPVAAQQYLYVASQEDVSVAVIDMSTNELVQTVDLEALGYSETAKAHDTAVEPDGSFWYVSLIAAGKVLKFDRDNDLVGQADFETPGMLVVDPASDFLYVGRSMAAVNPPQRIGVIRRSTMEIEEVDVFVPRPHAIAVEPKAEHFYTASLGQSTVAYGDVGEEEVDLLDIGPKNHVIVQFSVSKDGRWMVGGGQISGDLLVFDVTGSAPRVVNSVAVGGQPWHPSFTPDGHEVWVPNQTGNTVTVVDADTWSVSDVIHHPALVQPHGSAVSPDGRTVYVSSQNTSGDYHPADGSEGRPGTVVAIDRETHRVVKVIEVGRYAAGMSTATGTVGG